MNATTTPDAPALSALASLGSLGAMLIPSPQAARLAGRFAGLLAC